MGRRIGHGHHGEVWRAVRRQATSPGEASGPDEASGEPERYVLKRIFVERGADIRLAGLREVYFGVGHSYRFRPLQKPSALSFAG